MRRYCKCKNQSYLQTIVSFGHVLTDFSIYGVIREGHVGDTLLTLVEYHVLEVGQELITFEHLGFGLLQALHQIQFLFLYGLVDHMRIIKVVVKLVIGLHDDLHLALEFSGLDS